MSTTPGAGDLVRREHALVRRDGVARSTAAVSFDSTPLSWGDLPSETRRAARHDTPVVADTAVADGSLYLEPDGSVVQVMRGWRAHRDRLYVAVARRPVRTDGAVLRATGDWEPVVLRRWDAHGVPRRRVGVVPAGSVPAAPGASASPSTSGDSDTPAPVAAPEHAAASGSWPYLPPAVRASAERTVPLPQDWLGELVQQAVRGKPTGQTITVLRRDDEHAVVLRATRELPASAGRTAKERATLLASTDWQVEQVVMTTVRPKRLEATREVPWWM